jgi:cytochrome c peroxidase
MKTNLCTRPAARVALAAVVLIAHTALAATTIVTPESNLGIAISNSSVSVTISNSGDQVWTVQYSRDLANWKNLERVKIHNGNLRRAYSRTDAPKTFYRVVYDPTRQDIFSTTDTALLLPVAPFNYAAPALPPNFFVPPILGQDTTPATNLTTDAGATLGRVLFYDKRLSLNQTVSCSSCHQREHGFADPRRFSVGFNGGTTGRNAMGLSHARWYLRRHFFWDERANTLEDQVLMPIQNSTEMGMTLDALTNRLGTEPFYTNLFTVAFGTPAVTADRVSRALAQFVRSIVSVNSKYDVGVATAFQNFTPQENLGRQIFLGQVGNATCAACHGTDNFVPGPALNNNGLEFPFVDLGVGAITGNAADNGKFKVPSLRNIELTAPYMHDGRFATLEQVVEFYNSGVVDNPNLSPPLRNPPGAPPGPRRLNLTVVQKAALVAFLKTLTDTNLATNPKYTDPFNYGQ